MKNQLATVLDSIAEQYKDDILKTGRHYAEVNIGEYAEKRGCPELKEKYGKVGAVVPLKHPARGMKVRIDGRTFVNYAQYDSGIAVPGNIADDALEPYEPYVPNDSMILNFV